MKKIIRRIFYKKRTYVIVHEGVTLKGQKIRSYTCAIHRGAFNADALKEIAGIIHTENKYKQFTFVNILRID